MDSEVSFPWIGERYHGCAASCRVFGSRDSKASRTESNEPPLGCALKRVRIAPETGANPTHKVSHTARTTSLVFCDVALFNSEITALVRRSCVAVKYPALLASSMELAYIIFALSNYLPKRRFFSQLYHAFQSSSSTKVYHPTYKQSIQQSTRFPRRSY